MDPVVIYRQALQQGSREDAAKLADTQVCYEVVQRRLRKLGLRREPTSAEIDRLLKTFDA
jgi:hypothetical protein